MRLTFKLVAWFLVSVVVAVGVNAYLGVRSEVARYQRQLVEHHSVMGQVLRASFSEILEGDGDARAVSMLDYTDKRIRPVDIRWVSLDGASNAGMSAPQAPAAALRPLAQGLEVHHFDADRERLNSYVALRIEGRAPSALEFSEACDGTNTVLRHAVVRELRAVLAIGISAGIAAALFGVLFVGRPVQRLVEHARRVGRGDFAPRADVHGGGELGELAREMNLMCAQLVEAQETKLKALEQLRHAERLNTVGKLASGLAHELGTPLSVINLRAKAIASGKAAGDQAKESARSIAEQATRVTELVRRLLEFARRRPPERAMLSMDRVVETTAEFLGAVFAKANIQIDIRRQSQGDRIAGDAGQLQQVTTNLLMNAVQAMPRGGRIRVEIDDVEATPPADRGLRAGTFMRVRVVDEGIGIPAELLPHVFEPVFGTKEVGEGTGLGLSVCYGIARDHNGWIDVESEIGHGASFSVFLPKGQP